MSNHVKTVFFKTSECGEKAIYIYIYIWGPHPVMLRLIVGSALNNYSRQFLWDHKRCQRQNSGSSLARQAPGTLQLLFRWFLIFLTLLIFKILQLIWTSLLIHPPSLAYFCFNAQRVREHATLVTHLLHIIIILCLEYKILDIHSSITENISNVFKGAYN